MSEKKVNFGKVSSVDDAEILQDSDLPDFQLQAQSSISSVANVLWEYQNCGTMNGFPVEEDALGLPIESVDMLAAVMEPVFTPRVFVGWLSPDNKEGFDAYAALLKRAADKEIIISEEARQYDQSKSAFMVFVRYDEVVYRLHGRYSYLREEKDNG